MKVSDLAKYLSSRKVPEYYYTLGGVKDGDSIGIDFVDGQWVTYGCDRGRRTELEPHATEEAAIEQFLSELSNLLEIYGERRIKR